MALRVYALVSRREQVHGRGLEREALKLIPCGTLGAIVGLARDRVAPEPGNLKQHDAIVRRLAAATPAILPARFGVVLQDEAAVRAAVRERLADFRNALTLVTGRQQMTLRLRTGETAASRPPTPHPRARASGQQYLRARAEALRPPTLHGLDELRQALQHIVRAERSVVPRHPGSYLLYHLIDRGQAPAYRSALRRVKREFPSLALAESGPFPPYAFAPGLAG